MHQTIRFARLLSIAIWVGGLVFFAFVVAPLAFSRLPSAHEAGLLVGGTLRILHLLGLASGALFLVLSVASLRRVRSRRLAAAELALIVVMLGITAGSQFAILPAMEVARTSAGGDVPAAAPTDPARLRFEHLHGISEKLEGLVLFCGLAVLFALACERDAAPTAELPADLLPQRRNLDRDARIKQA